MREVEFRGLNKKGKFVYGSLVTTNMFVNHMPKQHTKTWIVESAFGNGGWFNIIRRQYVLPETVGQFTGFIDKNGSKIYQGDILIITQHIDGNFIDSLSKKYRICWGRFGWCLQPIGRDIAMPRSFYLSDDEECEVIGNIHQNPELLKYSSQSQYQKLDMLSCENLK